MKKIVIGLSGASGVLYGIRLLERLQQLTDVETHLIISPAARQHILQETDYAVEAVAALAQHRYDFHAPIETLLPILPEAVAIIILPCATKTLTGLVQATEHNLIVQTAQVMRHQKGQIVLLWHETTLHLKQVQLLEQALTMGLIIIPAMPRFDKIPKTTNDVIDPTLDHILAHLDLG